MIRKLPPHTTYVVAVPPPSILAGVGEICAEHTRLELTVQQTLCDTLRIDYGMGRLSLPEGIIEQFDATKRLWRFWDFKPSLGTKSLRADIVTATEKRNTYAHGLWMNEGEQWFVRDISGYIKLPEDEGGSYPRLLLPTREPTDAHICKDIASSIRATMERLAKIKQEVDSWLQAWPRTVPGQPPQCATCKDHSRIELQPPHQS